MPSPIQTRRHQHGFSLIELSIALAVIGVVVAGGLSMSTSMVDRQAYVQTGNQMDEIEKAIAAYVAVNNRLPCPADPAPAMGGIGFGVEVANCSALDPMSPPGDLVAANGTGGRQTWIGTLPVRTLGLRDRFIADEYGNRYTYAVTSAMTTTAGYENSPPVVANNGAITLQDGNGALIVDDAAYTVVSHGGDSKGAYRFESASNTVACAGGLDAENCDGDAVFRDARFNRGSVVANYFDDTTRFARREIINMVSAGADVAKQQLWLENGTHIYNSNTGNVGVGIANPVGGKLDIFGGAGDTTAININGTNLENGINIDNVIMGVRVDVDSELGHAVFATSSLDNGLLYRAMLTGDYATAFGLSASGANSVGYQASMDGADSIGASFNINGANSTGIDINTNIGAAGYWGSSSKGFRAVTTNSLGSVTTELATTQNGLNIVVQETGSDFDASGGNITVRTNCNGGSDCYGLIVQALRADGTNTGGAHFGLRAVGGVAGVEAVASATHGAGVSASNTATTGNAYGVYASTASSAGRAVYGFAPSAAGGITYGVYGQAASASGYGVYCNATSNALGCGGNRAWTNTSDERLKKNIKVLDITRGLEAIRKLRPVTYEWKDEANKAGHLQIGFIAQEVEKVIPEVVGNGADQEITVNGKKEVVSKAKAMSYAELTAPIVRAIQQLADALDDVAKDVSELLAKVSGHDAKIKALEAENASLKLRLDAIEKKLAE